MVYLIRNGHITTLISRTGQKMDSWLKRIKEKKRAAGLTNDELSAASGIPAGTLNKILTGVSDDPKLSTLIAFSRVFDVSLDYIAFGGETELSGSETELLRRFRRLDEHGQKLTETLVGMEYERVLAETACPKAPAAKILTPTRRYNFSSDRTRTSTEGAASIPIYDLPVSAGRGAFLDGNSSDFITVTSGGVTQEADFALRVSGDSMEPRYIDGDIILVHEQTSVEEGELGIFVCSDGVTQEGFFKRFGGDRLISLNPKYGDIPLDTFTTVICRGRVIGRLPRKS